MLTPPPKVKVGLIIAAAMIAIALICYFFINNSNVQKYIAFGTLATAIGAIIALVFVMEEAKQLKESVGLQLSSFSLDQRPYLYAYLKTIFSKNDADGFLYGVGNLCFENRGKVPADFILSETKYIIASDELGEIDNEKWFNEFAGGYPHVKVVFPGQEGLYVPIHPRIGNESNVIYVGALIIYKGIDPKKKYWYKFSQVFYISYFDKKENNGRMTKIASLGASVADHSWDMNSNVPPPELNIPDWKKMKDNASYYIKDKTEIVM